MTEQVTWQPGITLEQLEKATIIKALRFFQGNKTLTAQSLGIAVKTLYNKLEQYESEQGTSSRTPPTGEINFVQTESGSRLESLAEVSEEQSLPVQKREEIQEVSSSRNPRNNQRPAHARR